MNRFQRCHVSLLPFGRKNNKRWIARATIILSSFTVSSGCVAQWRDAVSEPARQKAYTELIQKLDTLIQRRMNQNHVLGVSIALVDDQSIVWAKGFGYTDNSRKVAIDEKTLFSVQSISKTYNALAFLMEVEKGNFKLDDKIVQYYPGFTLHSRFGPGDASRITFRQLLSHRSGLSQEAPTGNNYDTISCSFVDHINSISETWLRLPVGKFYSYSNMGPDIVGFIVAKKQGFSIEEYLTNNDLVPLGMKESTYDQDAAYNSGNVARGYFGKTEMPKTLIADRAAGGLYSNPTDMCRFISFELRDCSINGKPVISKALMSDMNSIQYAIEHQKAGYGLGVMVGQFHGAKLLSHAGGGYGYRAEQAWIPEAKVGVVVLTNDGLGSSLTNEVYQEALLGLLESKFGQLPIPESTPIPDSTRISEIDTLKQWTGTYKGDRKIAEISLNDGHLTRIMGTDTSRLLARSKNQFLTQTGEWIEFHKMDSGFPAYFIDLNEYDADYFILNDQAKEKPGMNKQSWRRLAGSYRGYANRQSETLTLYMKNGYLYSDRGGSTKITEFEPGVLFTSDGESVIEKENKLFIGNRPFTRE